MPSGASGRAATGWRRAARPEQLLHGQPERLGQGQRHPQRRVGQRRTPPPRRPGARCRPSRPAAAGRSREPAGPAAGRCRRCPRRARCSRAHLHRPGTLPLRAGQRARPRRPPPKQGGSSAVTTRRAVRPRPAGPASRQVTSAGADQQVGLPHGAGRAAAGDDAGQHDTRVRARPGRDPLGVDPGHDVPAVRRAPPRAAGPARSPGSRPARRPGARPGAAPPRRAGRPAAGRPASMMASRSAKAWASASSWATSTDGICRSRDQPADQARSATGAGSRPGRCRARRAAGRRSGPAAGGRARRGAPARPTGGRAWPPAGRPAPAARPARPARRRRVGGRRVGQVGPHRQVREDAGILAQQPDPALPGRHRPGRVRVRSPVSVSTRPASTTRAAPRRHQPGDDLQQRGLARARRAEQRQPLPRRYADRRPEGELPAVNLDVGLEHGRSRCRRRAAAAAPLPAGQGQMVARRRRPVSCSVV